MSRQFTISRREFLRVSAVAAAGALAGACAKTPAAQPTATSQAAAPTATPKPAEPTATKPPAPTPVPEAAKEAPMLADKVGSGALPALDQRLPAEPMALDPVEQLGQYGGTLVWMQNGDLPSMLQLIAFDENHLKFSREGTTALRPNLVSSYEWNAEATEIVLHFRKGIKWSDGEALTANDWVWWWENLVLDENIGIPAPTGTVIAGQKMILEKIDDYTLKCTFGGPNPLFLPQINRGGGTRGTCYQMVPAHTYEQFHYKFNTALTSTDVSDLRDRFNNRYQYPDIPHCGPFALTEFTTGEKAVLDRNPYYWKVDPEGNQLPYLDYMEARVAATWELIITKIIAGEVDLDWASLIKDWSVITENQASGDYHTMMWNTVNTVDTGLLFHYCYDDPTMDGYPDGLLWQRNFRRAMSVAIDRERMNDIIYSGLGTPRQLAMPAVGAEYASPRGQELLKAWETQDIEHDPDQAKQWLDELGVVDVNNDGMRERPDGSKLELVIDVDVGNANYTKAAELLQEDYAAVGLKVVLNVIDGTVLSDRATNCESQFRIRGGGASGLVAAPAHWAPVEDTEYTVTGPPFGRWYQTGGKEGMAPPPGSFIEKLQQAYAKAVVIADPDKQNDAILDAYQIHVDEGPIQLGFVQLPNQLVVVKNNLHNVPPKGIWATWTYGWPGAGDPEQWWKS
jgi:peptide/nickel transport system substrate-binding protein